MQPTPEQLMGLPVLDPQGVPLGTVVDVGLSGWRQPKFLLVRQDGDARLVRVELRQLEDLGAGVLRLAPSQGLPKPPSLPS